MADENLIYKTALQKAYESIRIKTRRVLSDDYKIIDRGRIDARKLESSGAGLMERARASVTPNSVESIMFVEPEKANKQELSNYPVNIKSLRKNYLQIINQDRHIIKLYDNILNEIITSIPEIKNNNSENKINSEIIPKEKIIYRVADKLITKEILRNYSPVIQQKIFNSVNLIKNNFKNYGQGKINSELEKEIIRQIPLYANELISQLIIVHDSAKNNSGKELVTDGLNKIIREIIQIKNNSEFKLKNKQGLSPEYFSTKKLKIERPEENKSNRMNSKLISQLIPDTDRKLNKPKKTDSVKLENKINKINSGDSGKLENKINAVIDKNSLDNSSAVKNKLNKLNTVLADQKNNLTRRAMQPVIMQMPTPPQPPDPPTFNPPPPPQVTVQPGVDISVNPIFPGAVDIC